MTLELAPAAAWVAEAYPTEAVTERADGSLEIVLAVSERAWLERLLLRLGPDAGVVAPADVRTPSPPTPHSEFSGATGSLEAQIGPRGAELTPGPANAHERMPVVNPSTSADSPFTRATGRRSRSGPARRRGPRVHGRSPGGRSRSNGPS